jgi:bacterioferritin (cytochrome b1)
MPKEKIIESLNRALELEHGAYYQYLSHAEIQFATNRSYPSNQKKLSSRETEFYLPSRKF